MFADHRFEILDHLQRHVVLLVTEIHERARIRAVFRNHDLDWSIWIDA